MRTLYALIFLLVASTTLAQTIRRVNADASVTGTNVYQTLQAAHNAAAAGDVLIVEPGNSVGDLVCTKTLTIYGNGVGSIIGSNITINAPNVKISGCLGVGVTWPVITINGVSGVVISRNYFQDIIVNGLASAPASNITISQNNIGSQINLNGVATGLVSNITISNNSLTFISSNSFTSNITVNQNNYSGGFPSPFPYNCTFTNNQFWANLTIGFSNNNSLFFYNAFTLASTIDSGMGTNNIKVNNFSDPLILTSSSTGGQIGMFGGTNPFVSLKPAAPEVTKLRSDGVGNSTTPITLTISAKSNN